MRDGFIDCGDGEVEVGGLVVTNFPSFIGFDKIRWCEKCLPGTYYTSNFGLDQIRWYVDGLSGTSYTSNSGLD